MACTEKRDEKTARPTMVPAQIEPGDVVTLKTQCDHDRKFVLHGRVEGMPGLWLAKSQTGEGRSINIDIHVLDFATVTRPATLMVRDENGKQVEVPVQRGLPPFFPSLLAALDRGTLITCVNGCGETCKEAAPQPAQTASNEPSLKWKEADARGEFTSECGLFTIVVMSNGMFRGLKNIAPHLRSEPYPKSEFAKSWCEGVKLELDKQAKGAKLRNIPGLVWNGRISECKRFDIAPMSANKGKFFACDRLCPVPKMGAGGSIGPADEPYRFSQDCDSIDDAKEWCEDRSKYAVSIGADGMPALVKMEAVNAATVAEVKVDVPMAKAAADDFVGSCVDM